MRSSGHGGWGKAELPKEFEGGQKNGRQRQGMEGATTVDRVGAAQGFSCDGVLCCRRLGGG